MVRGEDLKGYEAWADVSYGQSGRTGCHGDYSDIMRKLLELMNLLWFLVTCFSD